MRRLLAFVSALALVALALPATASAFVVMHGQCPASTTQIILCAYEDPGTTGDRFAANASIASLTSVPHVPSGRCNRGHPYFADDWNDCINSVEMYIPRGKVVCLYRDANYGRLMTQFWGPKYKAWSGNFDPDTVSSIWMGSSCR